MDGNNVTNVLIQLAIFMIGVEVAFEAIFRIKMINDFADKEGGKATKGWDFILSPLSM